jgi:hypothetical protein
MIRMIKSKDQHAGRDLAITHSVCIVTDHDSLPDSAALGHHYKQLSKDFDLATGQARTVRSAHAQIAANTAASLAAEAKNRKPEWPG